MNIYEEVGAMWAKWADDHYSRMFGGLTMTVRYDELEQTKVMLEAAIQKLEAAELLLHRAKNLVHPHVESLSEYISGQLRELDTPYIVDNINDTIDTIKSAQFDRPDDEQTFDGHAPGEYETEPFYREAPDNSLKCHPDCSCCKGCDA